MDYSLKNYISHNVTPVTYGRKCVDGRYDSTTEDIGKLACPGGDLGSVMVLLALHKEKKLNLTPQECVDSILYVLKEAGEKFYLHTDHHTSKDGKIGSEGEIGCGHAAKAMNPELAPLYGIEPEDLKKAILHIRKAMQNDDAQFVMVNLQGSHEERGVLNITTQDKTVRPHDGNHMYFIYDSARHSDYVTKLVNDLDVEGLTLEDFKRVADKQLQATLHNLALGQQIYSVNFTENSPTITPGPVIG